MHFSLSGFSIIRDPLHFDYSPVGRCHERGEIDHTDYSSTTMLVLFETPGGYALFKVLDEGKVKNADTIFQQFETPEKASSM